MVCHSDEPDLVPLRQPQAPRCSKPPSRATRVRLSRGSFAHAFYPEQSGGSARAKSCLFGLQKKQDLSHFQAIS
jgi:hypothetical protein